MPAGRKQRVSSDRVVRPSPGADPKDRRTGSATLDASIVNRESSIRQYNRLVCAALVVLLGTVYLLTLYPGVSKGDSAELQYMCPMLGVCHPPGYAVEVVVGKLFSLLPIGPNVAWRINFMQAVCGVVGCLALYGALRRLIGQILPALVASTTLGFSTIYWMHCVRAEVYVFYSMFLLVGLYTAVRFLTSDKSGWLWLTALVLGVCIGGRPSEVLVLPALVGLWLEFRGRVRLGLGRLAVAIAIAVLPFVFAVGFHAVRENPALLHARDDALRDGILEIGTPFPELSLPQRLSEAVGYSVGLKAAGRADFTAFSWRRLGWDLNKYAWLLSGRGALGNRFPEGKTRHDPLVPFPAREQGRGTSIGTLGVLLAVIGLWRGRRRRGVVLLGAGLFLGNLVYYAYMHPVDNLHFTIPGLAGLTVLIALGLSARTDAGSTARMKPGWSLAGRLACFLVPAFLLATNYRVVGPATPEVRDHLKLGALVKRTPVPDDVVIIATYSRAHTLRCLYWLDAGRTDVHVLILRERFGREEVRRLVNGLIAREYSVLISTETIAKDNARRKLAQHTPRELVNIGLFHPPPRTPGPRRGPGE